MKMMRVVDTVNKLDFNRFLIGLSNREILDLLQICQNGVSGFSGSYYEALEAEILEYILKHTVNNNES